MNALADLSMAERQAVLARTVALLSRSPAGSRALDALVAQALGWEHRFDDRYSWWRRYRLVWSRADTMAVPPRYTGRLDALLGELRRDQVLVLRITPGRCVAAFPELEPEVEAIGDTPELALAGALVSLRLQQAHVA